MEQRRGHRQSLSEADLNRGYLGIEIEFLLLSRFRDDILDALERIGFVEDPDEESVTANPDVDPKERGYLPVEIKSSQKMKWDELSVLLTRMLQYLKQKPDGKNRLGKVPADYSGGLHVHFDIRSWFDSENHAEIFLNNASRLQKIIPRVIPKGRYRGGMVAGGLVHPDRSTSAGSMNASVNEPYPDLVPSGKTVVDYFKDVKDFMGDRYHAVNINEVLGTVEFRFMHSTLNIQTITTWITVMAGLVDVSRDNYVDAKGFVQYLDSEHPGVKDQLKQRLRQSGKSKTAGQVRHNRRQNALVRHIMKIGIEKDTAHQIANLVFRPVSTDEILYDLGLNLPKLLPGEENKEKRRRVMDLLHEVQQLARWDSIEAAAAGI